MLRYLHKASHKVLISGGCGFIGSNLAAHLLTTTDAHLTLYDNLSMPGAYANLLWLMQLAAPGRLTFRRADVRNSVSVAQAVSTADEIYHLAAHCPDGAETRTDFNVNVTGTLNVLDAARRSPKKPFVLFASISDVYGQLKSLPVEPVGDRYQPRISDFHGIPETVPLDLRGAFECSVSAADRFMHEYAQMHGVRTVVLRLDTITGPRQFGDDQHAWVSNYVRAVLAEQPIRVIGNGLQVRDVLHVSDLVEAIAAARAYSGVTAGKIYNVGGGMSHTISVNEMIEIIERVCYCKALVEHTPVRHEQRAFYAADSRAFEAETGWVVRHSVEQTVRDVASFWRANQIRVEKQIPSFVEHLTQAA